MATDLREPPLDARGCGLRLIEISAIYEQGVVQYTAPRIAAAVAGLVARQRRLLRAAYVLADERHELEASILVRTMLEFLIVQKWLLRDPDRNLLLWVADDIEGRLRIDRELRERAPDDPEEVIEVLEPESGERYEHWLEEMRRQLEELARELGEEKRPRLPSLHDRAREVDLRIAYSMAYRFESQSAAHPSALAVEQLMQDRPDLGGVQLLAEPPLERSRADPYIACAIFLQEALTVAADAVPDLAVDGLGEVSARLEELRAELRAERNA